MSWINLADERAPEELERHGVAWKLELPRHISREDIEVNPKRLRKVARRAGLGALTITGGRIEQKTTASLNINPGGTVSATNARMNPRYNRGLIRREEPVALGYMSRFVNAFYRPDVEAQIDVDQLRNSHPRATDQADPRQWGRTLDHQIKAAVVEGSIQANVFDAAVPSLMGGNTPLRVMNAMTIGMKAWFGYKGIESAVELGQLADSVVEGAAILSLHFGLKNALALPFLGLMQGVMSGGSAPRPSDFKASLVDPIIPIDRPIIAGIHQYLGAPAVRGVVA